MAVCDGFSSAFALLAQKFGFECTIVSLRSAYSSTVLADHAWNIIKIRNGYYHIDVTWDARKYEEFREYSYDYFALTDKDIMPDHNWDKTAVPACSDNGFSYYRRNGFYANSKEQLYEIVKAYCRKNAGIFRIKVSHGFNLPQNAGDYLVQMVLNEVTRPGERKQASYSWNENTRCFFAKVL